jgi:bromodomain-containing factor 1
MTKEPETEETKVEEAVSELPAAADAAPDAPVTEAADEPVEEPEPPKVVEAEPAPAVTIETQTKPDVDMEDAPASADVSGLEPVESTQATTVSDAAPPTPAGELILKPSMSSLALDAEPASPPPIVAADTIMAEAPVSPSKLAREREEDMEEDEPLAKRVKTDITADSVEVKTGPIEKMEIDVPEIEQVTLFLENGEPKTLVDASLDTNSITAWQARKIRAILAGIKKTKAGGNFKLPVESMWPSLWNDYSAKVTEPTDISTMEKRLKGDPAYKPYLNLGDFKKDLELLYQNSLKFNGENHDVTRHAKTVQDQVLEKMAGEPAAEVIKPEKKETLKHHPTRHTEPRAAAQQQQQPPPPPPPQPARRQSKAVAASPVDKPAESPAFAIPPNNNGVPLIRRDSTKNADDRPKRPIHPPKSKDFGYEPKKKKKLSPDLRFCEEVLAELKKAKYFDFNQYFLTAVDPIALNIPNYHKVVKKPMDLQTMTEKLHTGQYSNQKDFEKDFLQIVKNCRLFNGEDHVVTLKALELENLFKAEWAKKDEWMAKHAPSTQSATSPTTKDDSEDEDADSEPEQAEEKEQNSAHLEALLARLKEENEKITSFLLDKNPDMGMVEVSQQVVALLQKQIIQERQKLAAEAPAKKPAKSKASKPKKAAGGGKKANAGATAAATPAAGAGKKSGGSSKKAKRVMGALEKNIIASAISELDGNPLEKAIEIIKKDTNQNVSITTAPLLHSPLLTMSCLQENDSGEIELDIEVLSQDALTKLYDISIKAFPELRAEKERTFAAPPAQEPTPSKSKSSKPKKNKPMGKAEQERRLQQLNDLKAAIKSRGSGSQEPIESIEGAGPISPPQVDNESDEEEESSEEE